MDFKLPEELKMIQGLTRDFVNDQLKPLERDILGRAVDLSDARRYLPVEIEADLIEMVRDMGLWGIGVPEELGGAGLSTLGVCLVEEELAQTVVPFNFGDITPILFDCGAEQQDKFLRPVLDGQKRPYLALMESDRGADLSSMKMKAEKVDGHYLLHGKKFSFSRLGDDYFAVVFAATKKSADGVTCFLVDKDTPGFTVAGGQEKPGWLAALWEPMSLVFNKCQVPVDNILGEEGKAFHLGKKWLPQRRVIRGARCVGIARRLLDEAAIQAQSLETFGQPVQQRTSIQAALADIATLIHATRLMVYDAAWKADNDEPILREAAMVKLYTTQTIHTVADRVAHIFNGPPYVEGLPMERLCRRALASSATELALELQRNIVARDVLKGLKI
jgi:alkylation response protein AidB-like acyl-CoA dehydrogenase